MSTTYQVADWLDYLEQLHPRPIELGLERIRTVADKLNLGRFNCPVITVAGTNGKGSCVRLLEQILLSAGYRVGAYTSPHLLRFNERIRINNQEVTDTALCEAFACIEQVRAPVSLTFFEFTTLAAFRLFQRTPLDVLILEVGLGGRLDAVNIVDADVAVLTTVDIDHTDWLGQEREIIGREKAGILRAGKPAVFGDTRPLTTVQQLAAQLGSPLYCLNRDFFFEITSQGWHWSTATQRRQDLPLPALETQNAASALMALTLLQDKLPITDKAIHQGLRQAQLPGRWQRLPLAAHCIADVGHNPHAARWLARKLQQEPTTGRTLMVVGMLANKDIHHTFDTLIPLIDVWYLGSLTVPRGANAAALAAILTTLTDKICYNHASIAAAWQQALQDYQAGDRVLVFGSFHTVAAVLQQLSSQPSNELMG